MEVNERYAQMTGYDPRGDGGHAPRFAGDPGPEGTGLPPALWCRRGPFEAMLNRKDGRTVPVEIHLPGHHVHGTPSPGGPGQGHQRDGVGSRPTRSSCMRQLTEVSEELSDLNQVATISVNVAQPELAMDVLVRQTGRDHEGRCRHGYGP